MPFNAPFTAALDQAILRRIRVKKADSAFVYAVLEACEGITGYSTLEGAPSDDWRDLELQVPVGFVTELDAVLAALGEMIYPLGADAVDWGG